MGKLVRRMSDGQAMPWPEMSQYGKLVEVSRRLPTGLLRAVVEEVAEGLRLTSMADDEMEAYYEGNISLGTLAARLEELAGEDPAILKYLTTHKRYGIAWHDDTVDMI